MKKTDKDIIEEKEEKKPTTKKKATKKNEEVENNGQLEIAEVVEEKTKKTASKKEAEKQEVKEETKKETPADSEKEQIQKIVSNAKAKGKITYGELAAELGEANPEQIDKVFEAFEEMGVNVLKDDDDLLEPDLDDLKEVEDIRLEELDMNKR